MPKKPIANHFADWMKRIGVRLRDLESNHEELKSQLEELEELIRSLRSSARKWMILRVSWRLRTPASMISRAKTASSNHRRTGRESRGGPHVRFLGAATGRTSSDCGRIESLRWAEASGSTR